MGQSAAANCGGERGLASAAAKKQTDATRPLNPRLGPSAKCQHESANKLDRNVSMALRKTLGRTNLGQGKRRTALEVWARERACVVQLRISPPQGHVTFGHPAPRAFDINGVTC
jgi:hypothetical protein